MVDSKSIAVFGGSGMTGQALISAALGKGLRVRALYRPGSEPSEVAKDLTIITGQLSDPGDIRRTLEGSHGAVLVFGPRLGRGKHPAPFCADATSRIISEMKGLGIERLVVQTGAMAGGDNPNWSGMVRRFVRSYRRQYPEINADRDAQEVATKMSGLDWTLVRPFRISGARGNGHPRIASSVQIGIFTKIRRQDLAEFLVSEVTDGRYHNQVVYIVS